MMAVCVFVEFHWLLRGEFVGKQQWKQGACGDWGCGRPIRDGQGLAAVMLMELVAGFGCIWIQQCL